MFYVNNDSSTINIFVLSLYHAHEQYLIVPLVYNHTCLFYIWSTADYTFRRGWRVKVLMFYMYIM